MKLNHEGEYICECENWEEPVLYPVAELIRCKECKYDHTCTHEMVRRTESGGYIYCPVEYCSEGERKEE